MTYFGYGTVDGMREITPTQREFGPDLVKAISILGVIYIHSHGLLGEEYTKYFAWIARSGVPCFILLWAYFTETALLKGRSAISHLTRRFTHIFTVFLIWSLVYVLLKDSWTMPTVLSWMIRHLSGGAHRLGSRSERPQICG